jgi:predicted NBD/HSP70 family sugar kinase
MKKKKRRTLRKIFSVNERSILHELRRSGSASKPELARQISISPQAANAIIDGLARDGLAHKCGQRGGSVGHPSTLYTLSPQGAFSIGLVITENTVEGCIVDFVGSILFRSATTYPDLEGGKAANALHEMFQNLEARAEELDIGFDRVCGIGVSLPSDLVLSESEHRFAFDAAIEYLAGSTGLPVAWLDHGAAGALAELMIGGAAEPASFLYVSIGPSFGSGLILDGALYRGGRAACQTGHLYVLPEQAREGPRIGDVATTGYLEKALKAAGFRPKGSKPIFEAIDSRRSVINDWIGQVARTIGRVSATTHAVLGLHRVVVTAELPNQLQHHLMSALWGELSMLDPALPRLRVERGRHGEQAVILGAAMLPFYRQIFPLGRGLTGAARSPDSSNQFTLTA